MGLLKFTIPRELQQLIDATVDVDSPFHLSHASKTDATVYSPPSESPPSPDERPMKKRRKETTDDDSETSSVQYTNGVAQNARYPNLVLANAHISELHKIVKRECEQLVDLSVSAIYDTIVRYSPLYRIR
jgi:proteasome activator subunit 3 (PA28 gamma)